MKVKIIFDSNKKEIKDILKEDETFTPKESSDLISVVEDIPSITKEDFRVRDGMFKGDISKISISSAKKTGLTTKATKAIKNKNRDSLIIKRIRKLAIDSLIADGTFDSKGDIK